MDELTADLAAVIEQARTLLGPPRPRILAAGNRLIAGVRLMIPGWPLGLWDVDGGAPGTLLDEPEDGGGEPREALRLVWLAETGHMLWLATDDDDPDLTVIVTD